MREGGGEFRTQKERERSISQGRIIWPNSECKKKILTHVVAVVAKVSRFVNDPNRKWRPKYITV